MGTGLTSPRELLQKWLVQQATQKLPLSATLQRVGIGAVVLHLQTLRPADALFLSTALEAEFGPPRISADGGEDLRLYPVPSGSTDHAREMVRSLAF
jgi:hypothetical protein